MLSQPLQEYTTPPLHMPYATLLLQKQKLISSLVSAYPSNPYGVGRYVRVALRH